MRPNLLDSRYQWFCIHSSVEFSSISHLLFFSEEKICKRKKTVNPGSDSASLHIHTHVYFVQNTNTHMPRFSPSGFSGPFRCLIPTPGLTPEYFAVCVCVCAYTHTYTHNHEHTHTYTHIRSHLRLKYLRHRQHSYLSCCQKILPRAMQQVPS